MTDTPRVCGVHSGPSTHICGPICPPCDQCAERPRMRLLEGDRFTTYRPDRTEASAHLDRIAEQRREP